MSTIDELMASFEHAREEGLIPPDAKMVGIMERADREREWEHRCKNGEARGRVTTHWRDMEADPNHPFNKRQKAVYTTRKALVREMERVAFQSYSLAVEEFVQEWRRTAWLGQHVPGVKAFLSSQGIVMTAIPHAGFSPAGQVRELQLLEKVTVQEI